MKYDKKNKHKLQLLIILFSVSLFFIPIVLIASSCVANIDKKNDTIQIEDLSEFKKMLKNYEKQTLIELDKNQAISEKLLSFIKANKKLNNDNAIIQFIQLPEKNNELNFRVLDKNSKKTIWPKTGKYEKITYDPIVESKVLAAKINVAQKIAAENPNLIWDDPFSDIHNIKNEDLINKFVIKDGIFNSYSVRFKHKIEGIKFAIEKYDNDNKEIFAKILYSFDGETVSSESLVKIKFIDQKSDLFIANEYAKRNQKLHLRNVIHKTNEINNSFLKNYFSNDDYLTKPKIENISNKNVFFRIIPKTTTNNVLMVNVGYSKQNKEPIEWSHHVINVVVNNEIKDENIINEYILANSDLVYENSTKLTSDITNEDLYNYFSNDEKLKKPSKLQWLNNKNIRFNIVSKDKDIIFAKISYQDYASSNAVWSKEIKIKIITSSKLIAELYSLNNQLLHWRNLNKEITDVTPIDIKNEFVTSNLLKKPEGIYNIDNRNIFFKIKNLASEESKDSVEAELKDNIDVFIGYSNNLNESPIEWSSKTISIKFTLKSNVIAEIIALNSINVEYLNAKKIFKSIKAEDLKQAFDNYEFRLNKLIESKIERKNIFFKISSSGVEDNVIKCLIGYRQNENSEIYWSKSIVVIKTIGYNSEFVSDLFAKKNQDLQWYGAPKFAGQITKDDLEEHFSLLKNISYPEDIKVGSVKNLYFKIENVDEKNSIIFAKISCTRENQVPTWSSIPVKINISPNNKIISDEISKENQSLVFTNLQKPNHIISDSDLKEYITRYNSVIKLSNKLSTIKREYIHLQKINSTDDIITAKFGYSSTNIVSKWSENNIEIKTTLSNNLVINDLISYNGIINWNNANKLPVDITEEDINKYLVNDYNFNLPSHLESINLKRLKFKIKEFKPNENVIKLSVKYLDENSKNYDWSASTISLIINPNKKLIVDEIIKENKVIKVKNMNKLVKDISSDDLKNILFSNSHIINKPDKLAFVDNDYIYFNKVDAKYNVISAKICYFNKNDDHTKKWSEQVVNIEFDFSHSIILNEITKANIENIGGILKWDNAPNFKSDISENDIKDLFWNKNALFIPKYLGNNIDTTKFIYKINLDGDNNQIEVKLGYKNNDNSEIWASDFIIISVFPDSNAIVNKIIKKYENKFVWSDSPYTADEMINSNLNDKFGNLGYDLGVLDKKDNLSVVYKIIERSPRKLKVQIGISRDGKYEWTNKMVDITIGYDNFAAAKIFAKANSKVIIYNSSSSTSDITNSILEAEVLKSGKASFPEEYSFLDIKKIHLNIIENNNKALSNLLWAKVGYFDSEKNKKFSSSAISVEIHPNNQTIANLIVNNNKNLYWKNSKISNDITNEDIKKHFIIDNKIIKRPKNVKNYDEDYIHFDIIGRSKDHILVKVAFSSSKDRLWSYNPIKIDLDINNEIAINKFVEQNKQIYLKNMQKRFFDITNEDLYNAIFNTKSNFKIPSEIQTLPYDKWSVSIEKAHIESNSFHIKIVYLDTEKAIKSDDIITVFISYSYQFLLDETIRKNANLVWNNVDTVFEDIDDAYIEKKLLYNTKFLILDSNNMNNSQLFFKVKETFPERCTITINVDYKPDFNHHYTSSNYITVKFRPNPEFILNSIYNKFDGELKYNGKITLDLNADKLNEYFIEKTPFSTFFNKSDFGVFAKSVYFDNVSFEKINGKTVAKARLVFDDKKEKISSTNGVYFIISESNKIGNK